MKDMLREIAVKVKARTGQTELYAEDFMDHGTKICLRVEINATEVRKAWTWGSALLHKHPAAGFSDCFVAQ